MIRSEGFLYDGIKLGSVRSIWEEGKGTIFNGREWFSIEPSTETVAGMPDIPVLVDISRYIETQCQKAWGATDKEQRRLQANIAEAKGISAWLIQSLNDELIKTSDESSRIFEKSLAERFKCLLSKGHSPSSVLSLSYEHTYSLEKLRDQIMKFNKGLNALIEREFLSVLARVSPSELNEKKFDVRLPRSLPTFDDLFSAFASKVKEESLKAEEESLKVEEEHLKVE